MIHQKQKTFFIPRNLDERLADLADRRGTSFTKLAITAILSSLVNGYLHDVSNDAPMLATVKLMRGEATVDEALQMIREGTK